MKYPPESTCRTCGGKAAPKYHTPRFMLVPQLRAELEVRTPHSSLLRLARQRISILFTMLATEPPTNPEPLPSTTPHDQNKQ